MDEYLLVRNSSPVISHSNPNISDEEETNNTNQNNPTPNQAPIHTTPVTGAIVVSGNGSGTNLNPTTPFSGSSSRKPRGRPPGSKNKPKPPVIVTRDSESAMRPVILELASGCDIIAALSAFSLRRRVALSVISGTGAVINVTIRNPNSPSTNIMFQSRFDILSLSGNVFLPNPSSTSNTTNTALSITMSGPMAQVLGGNLVGPLTAADTVLIVGAMYTSPEMHHLPYPGENEAANMETVAATTGVEQREVEGGKVVKSETTQHDQAPVPVYGGPPVGMHGAHMVRPEMALWSQAPPPSCGAQY